MKSAEEIVNNMMFGAFSNMTQLKLTEQENIKVIKKELLDAYKQGMTDAAEICNAATEGAGTSYSNPKIQTCSILSQAILTARDNKKEI